MNYISKIDQVITLQFKNWTMNKKCKGEGRIKHKYERKNKTIDNSGFETKV